MYVTNKIWLSRVSNVNSGLVYLVQELAFDRVDHEYLFNVMFGFGKSFLTYVKLLYAGASCMVKVGGGSVGQSRWDGASD